MSIITAWLSDLKLGYCTQGWWLNRKFCCWEMAEALNEAGGCEDWQTWTSFVGIQWLFYVAFAVSSVPITGLNGPSDKRIIRLSSR